MPRKTLFPAALALLGLLAARSPGHAPEPTWSDILPAGAVLEKVAGGFQFIEGPIWMKDGRLAFSDIPADLVYIWKGPAARTTPATAALPAPQVFIKPSHQANGHTLDRQGRLISCEHASRRVTRREKDGAMTVLASHYNGKRLNSPNDCVVKSDGSLYFTDPPYGLPDQKEGKELDVNGVYRLSPDGKLTLLVGDFERPNGIALSPDEKRLYVNDSQRQHIRVFDVQADGTVTNGRLFADTRTDKPGVPDGMRVDTKGNVYSTASGGVQVFAPSGKRLGTIETPEVAANCGWGDPDGKTLYITASTSLYRIRLNIKGLRP